MDSLTDTLAIAEKDITLSLRFKVPFFSTSMVEPFIRIAPFLLVYLGFFIGGASAFGGVTQSNFIIFLILGMLTDIFFVVGYSQLFTKFMEEKYWQTIEGILLAPVNKLSLLGGQALSILVSLIPSMLLFFGISFALMPVPLPNLLLCLAIIGLVLSISLAMGLIYASSALFNENFAPLFRYAWVGIVFTSCFYYPITVFEETPLLVMLKPVVLANPFYHAVSAIRGAWLFGAIEWGSIAYVFGFAVISPLLAVFVFNKLWKKLNIQGY